MLDAARPFIASLGWLYFPAALVLVFAMARWRGSARVLAGLALAGLSTLAYARFIEPRMLTVQTHDIALERCFTAPGAIRVALFSDTHISPFRYAVPISQIVERVNAADADAVMIAGDFASYLPPEAFDEAYAAFAGFDAPAYAVLGNHDHGLPGPDIAAPLTLALEKFGVAVIDDRSVDLAPLGADAELVGVSDLWEKRQDLTLFDEPAGRPRIALTHNPETMFEIAETKRPDLMLAGHTHGGQIYIPFFTCPFTGMCAPAREGLKRMDGGAVFVTTGTGQSVLPLRFMVPPRIDVLDIRWKACGEGAGDEDGR